MSRRENNDLKPKKTKNLYIVNAVIMQIKKSLKLEKCDLNKSIAEKKEGATKKREDGQGGCVDLLLPEKVALLLVLGRRGRVAW